MEGKQGKRRKERLNNTQPFYSDIKHKREIKKRKGKRNRQGKKIEGNFLDDFFFKIIK